MRSLPALAASALAGLAAVISSQDGDADFVPFFVVLTWLGGAAAWAAREPFVGRGRSIVQGIALIWLLAAVWVGLLFLAFAGALTPPSGSKGTYLGLRSTVYHLVGLYGGLVLVFAAAFGPRRWSGPAASS